MTNQVEDAAPGEADAIEFGKLVRISPEDGGEPFWRLSFPIPDPVEVVENDDELMGFGGLMEDFCQSHPETAEALKAAAKLLDGAVRSTQGLHDMDLAVAMAGGPEVAVGHMLEHLTGRQFLEGACVSAPTHRLVDALTPGCREAFVEALSEALGPEDLAMLRQAWSDDALPTFIPNVELWFADLDEAEQRELTDFVLAAAVQAGVVTRPSAAPPTATA